MSSGVDAIAAQDGSVIRVTESAKPLDPVVLADIRKRDRRGIDDPQRVAADRELLLDEVDRLSALEQRVAWLAVKFEQWPSGPSYAVAARAIRATLAGDDEDHSCTTMPPWTHATCGACQREAGR